MNWTRIVIAALAGAIATNLANFVMHGLMLANTYAKHAVFSQEPANPLWFLLVALCTSVPAAIIFAKTRSSWAPGVQGGVVFGIWLGLVAFFPPFYDSLVIEGFPYFLSWCWGGANLISPVIFGAVIGAIYKSQWPTPFDPGRAWHEL